MSMVVSAVSTGPSNKIILLEAASHYSISYYEALLIIWLPLFAYDPKVVNSWAARGPMGCSNQVPFPGI